jgi:hypothetical protein
MYTYIYIIIAVTSESFDSFYLRLNRFCSSRFWKKGHICRISGKATKLAAQNLLRTNLHFNLTVYLLVYLRHVIVRKLVISALLFHVSC